MTAWRAIRPGQLAGLLIVPLLAALLLGLPTAGHAQTITKLTDLNFGTCEDVSATTYTVAAAASPGVGACAGAQAAIFTVTGTVSSVVRVTLSTNVTVTNGTASLTVKPTDSGGGTVCTGTSGTVTLYVGGTVKIPNGGLGSSGILSTSTTISVAYQGKKSC